MCGERDGEVGIGIRGIGGGGTIAGGGGGEGRGRASWMQNSEDRGSPWVTACGVLSYSRGRMWLGIEEGILRVQLLEDLASNLSTRLVSA